MFKPKGAIFVIVLAVAVSFLFIYQSLAQNDVWRTIEFETSEVTTPDVAISPDGEWLIFTMLGHLFRLPAQGGTAEQLTFGPYWDANPAVSPEGLRVTFMSDRDPKGENVFVLDLQNMNIHQLTHEDDRRSMSALTTIRFPAWTPDGHDIVYLKRPFGRPPPQSVIMKIGSKGGKPEILMGDQATISALFYLPDGRLAWMVEKQAAGKRPSTRMEVLSEDGEVSTLLSVEGVVYQAVPSPNGDELYISHPRPAAQGPPDPKQVDLIGISLPDGAQRLITSHWPMLWRMQYAAAPGGGELFVGDGGLLWRVATSDGVREHIPFSTRTQLDVRPSMAPSRPVLVHPAPSFKPRSVLQPRLSPDGRTLVFGAAGFLWRQELESGEAVRLSEGGAFELDPAFSPDGRQVAFVRGEGWKQTLEVLDLETGRQRAVVSGFSIEAPNWSPDTTRIVFQQSLSGNKRLATVNLSSGEVDVVAGTGPQPNSPQFSADGQSIYFRSYVQPRWVLRLSLAGEVKPQTVVQLDLGAWESIVSPTGEWLVFRLRRGLWLVPLGEEQVKLTDTRLLSNEVEAGFSFTADGSALVYASGSRVWVHPVDGRKPQAIPIRLRLTRNVPNPILIRRARLLDFSNGGFGSETSLFIENGRIRWVGSEEGRTLPPDTEFINARGRFAIPGLFDMHVHVGLDRSHLAPLEVLLAYGITSVRDTGGWLDWLNGLVDRGEAMGSAVPRLFFCGELIVNNLFDKDKSDEEQAQRYVRLRKEHSAQFIKSYMNLSWARHRAVADEARRIGLPVVGHGFFLREMVNGATLGYASMEHTSSISWIHDRPYDDVLQLLARSGTRWVPTLTIGESSNVRLYEDPGRLKDPKLIAFTPEADIMYMQKQLRRASDPALRGRWALQKAAIQAANRLGVKLCVGTDSGADMRFLGSWLHWELENFVEVGIEPLEVLLIATLRAAEALGCEDLLGSLENGKLADIVLLDANPLEDIKNTQSIWRVIKGGRVFDPDKLRQEASSGKK